ncbi:MAG: hypothetical protein ACE37D_02900 [Pseudomonadales bacterium]
MRLLIFLALHLVSLPALSHNATAHYLANEGVMVENGATKVVFDPLFNNDYGRFELLPEDMKAALLAGEAPYDNLSAAFISHSHEDHFDPEDMVRLMLAHPQLNFLLPFRPLRICVLPRTSIAIWSRALPPSSPQQHRKVSN